MAYKIYGLKEGEMIRYIGQTKFSLDKRYKEHLRENKPCYKNYWIKSLIANGITPEVQLIDEAETRDEANEKEIHYIKLFKSFGAKLVNMTIGGVAPMKDKRHSDEHKNRLKESLIGNGNPFYGKKHSPEALKLMSDKKKGKPSWCKGKTFTDEHRKKLSEVRKRNFESGKTKPYNLGNSKYPIELIFELREKGYSQNKIAITVGCTQSAISDILNKQSFKLNGISASKVSTN